MPTFDVVLNPSDLSTVFSGDDMDVPANVGDLVSKLADTSGNDWHFTQESEAARLVLGVEGESYYVEAPEGGNHYLSCLGLDPGGAHKLTVLLGVYLPDYASLSGNNLLGNLIDENGVPPDVGQTAFQYIEGRSASGRTVAQDLIYTDDAVVWSFLDDVDFIRPAKLVLGWRIDLTQTSLVTQIRAYYNNAQRAIVPEAEAADPVNDGAFGARTWTIGDMLGLTSQPLKGRIYGLKIKFDEMSDADFALANQEMALAMNIGDQSRGREPLSYGGAMVTYSGLNSYISANIVDDTTLGDTFLAVAQGLDDGMLYQTLVDAAAALEIALVDESEVPVALTKDQLSQIVAYAHGAGR